MRVHFAIEQERKLEREDARLAGAVVSAKQSRPSSNKNSSSSYLKIFKTPLRSGCQRSRVGRGSDSRRDAISRRFAKKLRRS